MQRSKTFLGAGLAIMFSGMAHSAMAQSEIKSAKSNAIRCCRPLRTLSQGLAARGRGNQCRGRSQWQEARGRLQDDGGKLDGRRRKGVAVPLAQVIAFGQAAPPPEENFFLIGEIAHARPILDRNVPVSITTFCSIPVRGGGCASAGLPPSSLETTTSFLH